MSSSSPRPCATSWVRCGRAPRASPALRPSHSEKLEGISGINNSLDYKRPRYYCQFRILTTGGVYEITRPIVNAIIIMPKGEVPEIPSYLQESVRSAEAYEQDARREFQISDYARKRQIPEVSMHTNETVRRYVTVLRDADAAQERLGRFEAKEFVKATD